MKYVFLAAVVVAAGAAIYFVNSQQSPAEAHAQWKQTAIEAETKVRPAYFEDMKMDAPEVRAPASTEPTGK